MIIALMGNDGSGKTTIAQEISKKLKERGYNIIYKPGFDHLVLGLLVFLGKILLGKNADQTQQKFLHPGEKQGLVSRVWPYMVWIDSLLKYIWASTRPGVVLFDRCWYDFLISYEQLGYTGPLIRALFLGLPRPHCGVILDVSPEVMYRRKYDTHTAPLEYYVAQRDRYLELARRLRFPVVNTEAPVAKSTSQVMHLINQILE